MTSCTIWGGALNNKGYPIRNVDGRTVLAHRIAYQDAHGAIPDGYQIHHRCENRRCVNVAHLEARTPLAHNRAHMPVEAIGAVAARILADGDIHHRDEIAHATGATGSSITRALQRAIRRGEIVRVQRAYYRRRAEA